VKIPAFLGMVCGLALLVLACGSRPGGSQPGTRLDPSRVPSLARTINLPGVEGRIDHLAYDPAGKRLYIAALGNGSLEAVDVEKGERVRSVGGLSEPQGVVFVPATRQVVVASGGDGTVRAFDAATLEEKKKVTVGDDADNARLDAERGEIVVGYGDGGLAFLDPVTLDTKGIVRLPDHPESFQIESGTGRVFVNIPGGVVGGGGSVVVVDGPNRAVTATWALKEAGRNFPMALDAANKRLYVGCRRAAKLLVIDSGTGAVVASPECVGDADDIFVDPKTGRVLVTGGDGALDLFTSDDQKSYTRAATVPTAPGARTALLVPELHTLFVAAPKRDGKDARLLVYTIPE
jgi:DNA-binding beta-propeller fold protein YncE